MDIMKETELIKNHIVNLRKHFHMYPELGLEEFETSRRIKEELHDMEIPYISVAGTGVIGFVGHGEKVITLRADMDALRVVEKNEVSYRSRNEGIMHACGHDAHMASLLGAASILKKHEEELNCTIKLLFQPSEENCKGAKLVVEEGHLDHVEEIFGLHIFGDIPCGQISIESGPRMAASDIFKIRVTGKSGHAGKPQQCVDATIAGAAVVLNLQTIVSREMDPIESAVVTIGHFISGSQHNIVSGEALIEGTVRTFSLDNAKYIEKAVNRIASSTATSYNCTCEIEYKRSAHPVVVNDEQVVKTAYDAAKKLFKENMIVQIPKMMLGEDFSVYQKRVPGAFAFVGGGNEELGRAYPNHHERFNIDEKAVINATKLFLGYVQEYNNNL